MNHPFLANTQHTMRGYEYSRSLVNRAGFTRLIPTAEFQTHAEPGKIMRFSVHLIATYFYIFIRSTECLTLFASE